VAELNAMPQHTKEVAFGVGPERSNHTFKGALLYDVLNGAGPAVDPKAKGDLQRFVITVVGADGYDPQRLPGARSTPIWKTRWCLLATVADGKSLTRPELVVPFDTKGGRYINDVVRVDVSRPTLRGPKPHKR